MQLSLVKFTGLIVVDVLIGLNRVSVEFDIIASLFVAVQNIVCPLLRCLVVLILVDHPMTLDCTVFVDIATI